MTEVSVSALLPSEAKQPVNRNLVEMIARGLINPTAGIAQRLAIDLLKTREELDSLRS